MNRIKAFAIRMKLEIAALYLAVKRNDIGFVPKMIAVIVVGYALSPIDLIPDFIPVLGYLDDMIILPLGIALAIKLIPPDIMKQCRDASRDAFSDGKPKNWIAGLMILCVWAIGLISLMKWMLQ